jgi:3-dehydroquinate dehydratase type I
MSAVHYAKRTKTPARLRLGGHPLIIGCVATEPRLRACARKAPADCDWLEVRLDLTGLCKGKWLDWCAAAQARGRPVLLTIRDSREGGKWKGREADRLALVLDALPVVAAVDMEIGAHALMTVAKAARLCGSQVVGSFHDFKGTPDAKTLQAVEIRGRQMGADVVKIAATVRSAADLARLLALPAQASGPLCVLGMGARGAVSRVALPGAGSCLAYGALDAATAPGQLSCRELARELARWGIRKR